MTPLLRFIKNTCEKIIEDIDTGNCDDNDYGLDLIYRSLVEYEEKDKWIDSRQAADELGVGYSTFTKLVRDKKLSSGTYDSKDKKHLWRKGDIIREYQRLKRIPANVSRF